MTVMMARLVMMMMTMTMMMTVLVTVMMAVLMTVMPQVIDHEEDNLSDKETYSKNIPAIGKNLLISIVYADTDTGSGMICPNYV